MEKLRKYADLHCHASFMSFLWKSRPRKTMRQKMMSYFQHRFVVSLTNASSDIDQLIEGRVGLISSSLYAIERGFTQLHIVRFFLFFMTMIDGKRLQKIRKGKMGYFEQIIRNITYIKKALQINPKVQFRLLTQKTDWVEDHKVNVVLSIEGAHGLISGVSNKIKDIDKIWKNLDFFKNDHTVRIFYLTLVHIQQSPFANHALGIPQKALRHKDFMPKGFGITAWGFELIQKCYAPEKGRPIYIDIKHMSLVARQQFYTWKKQHFPALPIIASHMGLTGESYKKISLLSMDYGNNVVDVLYQPKISELGIPFNSWTINLYDEEIIEIMQSGGLIGLSFDLGILGAAKQKNERLTKAEYEYLLAQEMISTSTRETQKGKKVKADIDYFVNNLVHIFKVANEANIPNPENHICIGSDFDGMILPIKECSKAQNFQSFEATLTKKLLHFQEKGFLSQTVIVESLLEKLMFSNFKEFVLKWI
jgi:microsomal dipeptidase-like Zn-dependent dipeptidase